MIQLRPNIRQRADAADQVIHDGAPARGFSVLVEDQRIRADIAASPTDADIALANRQSKIQNPKSKIKLDAPFIPRHQP